MEYMDPELLNRIDVVPTAEVLTKKPRNETRLQRGEAHQARLAAERKRNAVLKRNSLIVICVIIVALLAWFIYLSL